MTNASPEPSDAPAGPRDFIRAIIADDLAANRRGGRVVTRFPPEPNGYLHIGHAKAIILDFGVAAENGGVCHLRFDDTNPVKEEEVFARAIEDDVRWLGFDWGEHLYHASDYFDQLYEYAVQLIRAGKAYVCSLKAEEMASYRGTLTEPGRNSPYRDRTVEENLDLFERMRAGEFEDGSHVLRAKIDMKSPNMNMRDPTIYRIRRVPHARTGDKWCIYPMYDYTHCLSDSIEGITHSLCTLEFEAHRPLYDWFLDELGVACHPQQIEFARGNLGFTVMSKRMLRDLVEEGHVAGWDDPRMPTLTAMRRRGYPPEAIRSFWEGVGIAKRDGISDIALLEHAVREHLNRTAPRVMGVLDPVKVIIDNYPEGATEELDAINNPEDESMGSRRIPFSREILIERDDFLEDPPRKFFRMSPGREVRLRYAYLVTCVSVVKDPATGAILEIHCTYDPASRGGSSPDGRKVKGTLHWVDAAASIPAEIRLYDRLFVCENPLSGTKGPDGVDYRSNLNPNSVEILKSCRVEPSLATAEPGTRFQFERQGYFCVDTVDSNPGALVINRTVPLRDSWSRIAKSGGG